MTGWAVDDGPAGGLGIISTAAYLPGPAIGNAEVAARAGTTVHWITDRTGMLSRHRAAPEERTSDLATAAARLAIEDGGVRPDLLVLATVTADQPVPATACAVQDRLGLSGVAAFDVDAACSGYLYALVTAWGWVRAGLATAPLVVGADTFTRHVDPGDRRTAPLFGDGAGATVLGPVPSGYGILAAELWAAGDQRAIAEVPPKGGDGLFRMDGRAVRDVVLERCPKVLTAATDRAGLRLDQLDRVIVHQANPRLVGMLADSLGLGEQTVPRYGARTGNMAAATIPVTLALAHLDVPLARGDHVALVAVGAGMTAAAVVLRWY
jgi:3-oxoacyl-(acyl-carrier-protein) synthase III